MQRNDPKCNAERMQTTARAPAGCIEQKACKQRKRAAPAEHKCNAMTQNAMQCGMQAKARTPAGCNEQRDCKQLKRDAPAEHKCNETTRNAMLYLFARYEPKSCVAVIFAAATV